MRKRLLFCLFLILFITIPQTNAEEIIFSINQTEYYFLVNQDATIPVTINNTFSKDIAGQLSYTIVQTVNQGGMQYSSSNTNAQSFVVQPGNFTVGMNFGTSSTPVTLTVSIEFSFTEQDEFLVSLDDIIIHFVSNTSQMNNQQNQMQSTSEKIINAPKKNNNQQQSQTSQEKLQNNQLNQDSQALKQQMQQQMQEQQQMKDAFEQTVMNNTQVESMQQDIQDMGYNVSNKEFSAETNTTGMFNFTYQNEKGETATLEGMMEEGEITSLQKMTAEDQRNMINKLNESSQFQNYQKQLQSEGYNQTDISFHQEGNKTTVEIEYKNEKNMTAQIKAEFLDEELKEVRLEKQDEFPLFAFFIGILICIAIISWYLINRYVLKKQKQISSPSTQQKKPFDYRSEAQKLLSKAKQEFDMGHFKSAYGKAGQSLRLFLSYYYGINKEMTNDEIIQYLQTVQQPHQDIKDCLELCSLVEFAKYNANESDFSKIVHITSKILSQ